MYGRVHQKFLFPFNNIDKPALSQIVISNIEYWIVDWRKQQVEVYRREQAVLNLVATLMSGNVLNSPLLPGFTCAIASLFA
ncbi:Uma2 family endonuclease [Chroococcidiopsis sp. FACHB-1243]|nr:Uma2 family endonuclease [Chroococcidiopsis sp. [FACHB-1243]]MBD2303936.1 Uma2 family endonuclease [Chroococcidiopsis sp. [FACHB-1243]]